MLSSDIATLNIDPLASPLEKLDVAYCIFATDSTGKFEKYLSNSLLPLISVLEPNSDNIFATV